LRSRYVSIFVLFLLVLVPTVSGSTVSDSVDDGIDYMVLL